MSHYSKIFNKVPIQVPNRSGFDLSHENVFTATVGTLVPMMCSEVLPGDTVSLGHATQIQLPTMATDFYGKVEGRIEAFFVPNRILYGGWQDFMTSMPNDPNVSSSVAPRTSIPSMKVNSSALLPGSLADYLGFKIAGNTGGAAVLEIPNILPFVCYHKIFSDWYRDSRLQKDVFVVPNNSLTTVSRAAYLPYMRALQSTPVVLSTSTELALNDGVNLYDLRQRNYQRDYFTNATPRPQSGDDSVVGLNLAVSGSSATGAFSIKDLRAANALQQWMERNNLAGFRYGDQIKAQFGVYPSDAVTDRSLYLGSARVSVYNKSVYQSQSGDGDNPPTSQNPFSGVGTKYASPMGVSDSSLIDKFTANEHGFIFVMFSLCPSSYYATGANRMFLRNKIGDYAFPMLAGVGDQEIFTSEISSNAVKSHYGATPTAATFGYTQRYSEYKYMNDEVHGLLNDGSSLSSFALKRSFVTAPSQGTSFIQIAKTSMDDVSAVASAVSTYGCWVDSFLAFKKISTLPAYSIPTLGEMKDTHTEVIDNGGKML